ncbi:hypothetical protein BX666DRAFT_196280 [Dichotomocladium elegans]|nr:hypothetical protein BX666DRAFT_196280 [Dichotomocladium elegans]
MWLLTCAILGGSTGLLLTCPYKPPFFFFVLFTLSTSIHKNNSTWNQIRRLVTRPLPISCYICNLFFYNHTQTHIFRSKLFLYLNRKTCVNFGRPSEHRKQRVCTAAT